MLKIWKDYVYEQNVNLWAAYEEKIYLNDLWACLFEKKIINGNEIMCDTMRYINGFLRIGEKPINVKNVKQRKEFMNGLISHEYIIEKKKIGLCYADNVIISLTILPTNDGLQENIDNNFIF